MDLVISFYTTPKAWSIKERIDNWTSVSFIVGGNAKWHRRFGRDFGRVLRKLAYA